MEKKQKNTQESQLKVLTTVIRDLKGSLEILESSNIDMDKESLKMELQVLEKRKREIEMKKTEPVMKSSLFS